MELNTAYKVAHANKRRETQAIALQGNTAYNNYSTQDNGYTMVENNGRETFASKNNTAYAINREVFTTETNSTSNVLSNTNKKRQGCAKNRCTKKWFAIFTVLAIAFSSLLVAVAALVYTNIVLKNLEDQSMTGQLNNQSSTIEPFNLGTINNPASSCSDISQD